jgi:hypothetical protein
MIRRLTTLSHGHHGCLFFDTLQRALAVTIPFLEIGLKRKERCLYLADPLTILAVKSSFLTISVDRELRRGSLILSSDRNHLTREGLFDEHRMIDFLGQAEREALKDGFTGFRATGDVLWEMGKNVNSEQLARYELMLDNYLHGRKITGLCQYRRDAFPAKTLRHAFRAHNAVIYKQAVCVENAYHGDGKALAHQSFESVCRSLSLPEN